jgi:hypothetical protein
MTLAQATAAYDAHKDHKPTFVHAGFTSQKPLAEYLGGDLLASQHLFIEEYANALYRKYFDTSTRILVRDGFRRLKNADYTQIL